MTCRKISLQGIMYLLLLLHGEDLIGQTGNSLGNGSVHNPQSSAGFETYPANAVAAGFVVASVRVACAMRRAHCLLLIRENVLLILTRRVPETKR